MEERLIFELKQEHLDLLNHYFILPIDSNLSKLEFSLIFSHDGKKYSVELLDDIKYVLNIVLSTKSFDLGIYETTLTLPHKWKKIR